MSAESEFIEKLKPDLRAKLILCSENMDKLGLYPPDPMHGARHLAQVERTALWLAEAADLDKRQTNLIKQAVPLHDSGYSFVEMGILKPEEHNYGSGLVAFLKTGDIELANGIVKHLDDVLPVGTPPWILLLREADRSDRWGWQGVISAAYYLGFRHELVNGPVVYQKNLNGEAEVVDRLRDKRHPDTVDYRYRSILDGGYPVQTVWTWTDYEEDVANFARKEIFPYLHKNSLLNKVYEELENAQSWIEGIESEDSTLDDPRWEVDSVVDEGSYAFFSAKRFNTEQAMRELSYEYEGVVEHDAEKLKVWAQPLVNLTGEQEKMPLQLIFRHIVPIDRRGARKMPLSRRKNIVNHQIIYLGDEYIEHELV